MIDTWNIVEKENTKIVWKDVDATNLEEIRSIESQVGSEPYFCPDTKSVVFKTTNKGIRMEKGPDYSNLELISRYLKTENKLYELLNS